MLHWIRLDRLRCEPILHEVTESRGAAAAVAAQKDKSGPPQSFSWNNRVAVEIKAHYNQHTTLLTNKAFC